MVSWQFIHMSQESVFKPGYIIQIFNSQHGWIFIMVINNQYCDGGLQNLLQRNGYYFINGHYLFYNGGNSSESL